MWSFFCIISSTILIINELNNIYMFNDSVQKLSSVSMWLVVVDCIVYQSFDCVLSGLCVSCSRMFIELPVTKSYIRLFKKCRNDNRKLKLRFRLSLHSSDTNVHWLICYWFKCSMFRKSRNNRNWGFDCHLSEDLRHFCMNT